MNKVVILGRLTKDPELKFAAGNGTAVSKFTVAVNRQFKKGEADFINCVAFGKTAETISQYFTKGKQIAVSGAIRTGSYDAQDGTKRYTTDVAVDSFSFTESGGDNKGNLNSNEGSTDNNQQQNNTGFTDSGFGGDITPVDDGDMPFK